jgi:hypothetical protein
MKSMQDLSVPLENPLDIFHSRLVHKTVSFQISNLPCSTRGTRKVCVSGICSYLKGFEGFWRWCTTLRVTCFLYIVHRPEFCSWITMKHNVSETGSVSVFWWGYRYTLLGPFEKLTSVTGNISSFRSVIFSSDRLCGLVVRVLGYRSGGPGSIPCTTRKKK